MDKPHIENITQFNNKCHNVYIRFSNKNNSDELSVKCENAKCGLLLHYRSHVGPRLSALSQVTKTANHQITLQLIAVLVTLTSIPQKMMFCLLIFINIH